LIAAMAAIPAVAFAQAAQPAATEAKTDEEVVELGAFEVSSTADSGSYVAKDTLAGTRIKTSLDDVASSISVMTSKFLQDTGARDNQSLLQYTTNTEVGGTKGNFGGVGNSFQVSEQENMLRPNEQTRVRGLDKADNTRNYFLTRTPWSGYNVDRVELQRGPNSTLFGVGSPAGIINVVTITPNLTKNSGDVTVTTSFQGSIANWREEGKYNYVLIPNVLAVKIAAMHDDQEFQQRPAFQHDNRVYAAATFKPQLLPKDVGGRLDIRANFEVGKIDANRPRVLPPIDKLSTFYYNTSPQDNAKRTWDTWMVSQANDRNTSYVKPPGAIGNRFQSGDGAILAFYNQGNSLPTFASAQDTRSERSGPNPLNGKYGNGVMGVNAEYTVLTGSQGYNAYAKDVNFLFPSLFPLASSNFYRDRSLSDRSVFNYYKNLIDGDNKREYQDFKNANIAVAQDFFNRRFGIEVVWDFQDYGDGRRNLLGGSPGLSVDTNMNLQNKMPRYSGLIPTAGVPQTVSITVPSWAAWATANGYPTSGTVTVSNGKDVQDITTPIAGSFVANPNAGKIWVDNRDYTGEDFRQTRENYRLTAFVDGRASDLFDEKSLATTILGHHTLTGLLNQDTLKTNKETFQMARTDPSWITGYPGQDPSTFNARLIAKDSFRAWDPIVYIGDATGTSPAGLNLARIQGNILQAPSVTQAERWNGLPDAHTTGWTNAQWSAAWTDQWGRSRAQSVNPDNFIGWETAPVSLWTPYNGHKADLYTDAQRTYQRIESAALTYQGYFFGGNIVPTYSWRQDTVKMGTVMANRDRTPAAYTAAGLPASTPMVVPSSLKAPTSESKFTSLKADEAALWTAASNRHSYTWNKMEGETRTWGIVAHMPESWAKKLPGSTRISAFYNHANNNIPVVRYGYDGNALTSPAGKTVDYGLSVSTLNDKVNFKVTRYKTTVTDASYQGSVIDTGNLYLLTEFNGFGTAQSFWTLYNADPYNFTQTPTLASTPADRNWTAGMAENISSDFGAYMPGSVTPHGNYLGQYAGAFPSQSAASWAEYTTNPSVVQQFNAIWNFAFATDVDSPLPVDANKPPATAQPGLDYKTAQKGTGNELLPTQAYLDMFQSPLNRSLYQQGVEQWLTHLNYTAADQLARREGLVKMYNAMGGAAKLQPGGNYMWSQGSGTQGRVAGQDPVINVDTLSKGWEFEVTARPVTGWDITINASKTEATLTKIGESFVNIVQQQEARWYGPAGDLRLWWTGSPKSIDGDGRYYNDNVDNARFRRFYNSLIYSPARFALEAVGKQLPEVAPWRFNFINNYAFQEGSMKGVNVGGAFRWQDSTVLGYMFDDPITPTKLDPSKPISGKAEYHFDVWVGYERPINEKITWRIQMNASNIFEKDRLVPVTVNPDGTAALQRIAQGTSYSISNTFKF
jgi:outer membrane receptor protein involved in Fe transport